MAAIDYLPSASPIVRAIGVSRVSEIGDRGERLRSFTTQSERMALLCSEHEWQLDRVIEEPDISGGRALDDRPGLLEAVEAIEDGQASVLVVAFKNRLERDPGVRDEVIDRVEAVGAMVWAADAGRQTNADAVSQFTGTTLSAADRMVRRQAGERSRAAVIAAVEEGIVPWDVDGTLGYRRGEDRILYVVEAEARAVREAYEMRAGGATIAEVRARLAEHGFTLSYRQVQGMLRSTLYLGRIDFKALHNPKAHDAIVTPELHARVQAVVVKRGPRTSESDRLLARTGVLRCATCGGGMTASKQTQNGRKYPFYRCGKVAADCDRRAAISAEAVEAFVLAELRREAPDEEGTASALAAARHAAEKADEAEKALRRARRIAMASGADDEDEVIEELEKLRANRDRWREEADRLELAVEGRERVRLVKDWDRLSLAEQRDIIVAGVESAVVLPGRGDVADRVTVTLR